MLSLTLWGCGCYRSAWEYSTRGLALYPKDLELQAYHDNIQDSVAEHFKISYDDFPSSDEFAHPSKWPDEGMVRREEYPWNVYEVDRYTELEELNEWMQEVAPKLEIKTVKLPALNGDSSDYTDDGMVTQLGVFAKEDIKPGEVILEETSYLTANNRLQDALCDACSGDLPPLDATGQNRQMQCPDCEIVFCSEKCYDKAMELYHTALCDRDVEGIAKDVDPAQAADSLYSLLLLRVFAMAEEANKHPLEVPDVRFIWADFHPFKPAGAHWKGYKFLDPASHGLPRTLNFSFENNIRLPLHMLEKMDVDFFADTRYSVWVFNTLYAKFRGTASARLSGRNDGRAARGPEVCAVHPMWCMANHSCDPNVSWEWGGSIKFTAREERVGYYKMIPPPVPQSKPGIKKGEEVLGHYCDIHLPVDERREWAAGALGGKCMCKRCVYEAIQHLGSLMDSSESEREREKKKKAAKKRSE